MKIYEERIRSGDANNPTGEKTENSCHDNCADECTNDPPALANQIARCHL